ncbi:MULTISPECIES: DUF4230 domain-containing protein [Streptomyces]|uniref:DUF4230 domain-containing protein n=1 Tax=Streptomyces TaxID=1883 RepID=UPI00226ED627|nr:MULTISPECIES: DUF4230 domain-containing protein [unclassified Streptomyces]MCY0941120.1 DUF4230 domain-containing protein [Streptomyces sp. H34-AA3]MCY0949664.1 DUF4230 domain-containing protein [Streptomyces sp. H27-S2]MCZ4084197.1 DUF4230 domain-containing protein [Streptomyces sp. H34-S5]
METSTQLREEPGKSARSGSRWLVRTAAVLVALAALLVIAGRFSLVPGFGALFGDETRDRTGPAVLKSIQDMSRYEGAAGNYQVVVDLEKDAKLLPDAIRGTRTLYVGAGTVSAYVDLGRLGEQSVTVNEDRTEAVLRLPHAGLGDPALDPARSYAVSKERGLLDRLGDFFSGNPAGEQAVQKLAVRHIADAARDSGLTQRAEKNTAAMLEGLLRSLGFSRVTVTFV